MTTKKTIRPIWIDDGSEIPDPFGYGERAVRWLRKRKHPKNPAKGHPFQLDPWQERIIRKIYGPRHPDGTRIVQTVLLLLPRGSRKTSLAAAITLLHLCGPEMIPGGLIQSAASARNQAKECYEEVALILNTDKRLRPHIRIQDYKNRIVFPARRSKYEAISADSGVQHGSTPAVVIADELHAWKKRDLWDVLDTAVSKTRNTLMVVATTAGRGQENIAFETVDYARKVQAGEIDDPSFLPVLFEAPKDADWKDEPLWHEVNPGLAYGYPDIEGLRRKARKAAHSPADRDAFRQLHLNVWLDHSTSPFVDMDVFDAGRTVINDDDLEGLPCWIAVDCSKTTDLTGVLAVYRDDDEYLVKCWGFLPGDNIAEREKDGVPYGRWATEGWIKPTAGNVIDYRAVEQHIRDICARSDVQEIEFDPAYAQQIMGPLTDDGFPTVTMRQGWVTQSPALNELERAIVSKKLKWDSPVLRWCMDNVAIHTDSAGNRLMHKGKSRGRIDLAVCLWMALSRAAQPHTVSVFDSPDFRAEDFVLS